MSAVGSAEFRLLIFIGVLGSKPHSAVILNKGLSLVVVASALPFRMGAAPLHDLSANWTVIVTLLTGRL
jgi:hypothetical protein